MVLNIRSFILIIIHLEKRGGQLIEAILLQAEKKEKLLKFLPTSDSMQHSHYSSTCIQGSVI